MNNFENIYLELLGFNNALKSCILQETLLPLFNADQISIDDLKDDDFFYVTNDLKTDYVITQEIYKKSIFKTFINDVRSSDEIKQYSLQKMKSYFSHQLKPIKSRIKCFNCEI